MNHKKRILVAGGIAVLFVVVVVPAVLLYKGVNKFSAARQDLNLSVQGLRSLYNQEPFPSGENAEKERRNVRAVEQWHARLLDAVSKGQILEEASTPTGFITHFGHVRNELIRLAGQRDRQMVGPDFAFGFERYADGSLPTPPDVGRLMQQLRMIEQIALVLIDSGVKQIERIRRDEFETDPGGGGEETGMDPSARRRPAASRRPSARTQERSEGAPSAERKEQIDPYDKQHFTVLFKATESSLLELLNRLAGHRMFVVVTGMEFRKAEPDLRMPQPDTPGADDALGDPPPAAKPKEDFHPRQMRRVSGPEFETPMAVTIDLDVYTFGPGPAK